MTTETDEIIVDSFAGGGGASVGIERATGRPPDVAINHEPAAIEMHAANHPHTVHYTEDVFKATPRRVTKGRPVGLLWLSPDCKHFSRAKGGTPVSRHVRGLAWVAIKWAVEASPRVIILENVREFEEWGPLLPKWECRGCDWYGTEGQATLGRRGKRRCPRCESARLTETAEKLPDPTRKGLTFKIWVGRLRGLGYTVAWRVLNAADFGAPTHRRRLFLVARRDGQPIVWPDPTHGDPKKIGRDLFSGSLKPWRTAAECIDWSIPCPSIFLTREEGRKLGVNRPLAENTLRRIALGIKRYVLDNPKPFIVTNTTGNPPAGVDGPLKTVTTGNHHYLTTPVVVPVTHAGERRANEVTEPLPTVTGANRGELALTTPFLARIGQSGGNGKYANDAGEPITTVTTKAEHLLVAPTLVQTGYGERDGQAPRALDIEAPLGTVVAGGGKHALVAAFLAKHFGGQVGQPVDRPQPTTTTRGTQTQLVTAFLAKHYGGVVGHPPDRPLGTVTAIDHHSVVAANLVHLNHGEKTSSGADEPARTVTASGNHAALVYSFLQKYYSTGGQWQAADEPLHTVTTNDRLSVVTVTIDGAMYAIVDIGMRMLRPRELANAQGFDRTFVLTGSATNQVERIGNSVCPQLAEAMVRANYTPRPAGVAA